MIERNPHILYSLVMVGLALVCVGCSSECDPVELCPEMDEVIGCCHKKGWDVCEVDHDDGASNEWHGVELGPGDEIIIKEKRLNGVSSLRDSLDARHTWWQSKYGKN